MDKLFQIYKRLLEIHIQSFTTWTQFHKDTEEAYNLAFDVFHLNSEMKQALWQEPTTDCEENGQEAYNLIEEMKAINESLVKANKDIWFDNNLRTLAEKLTLMCWKFRQYTEAQEEEEEESNETILRKPNILNNFKI